MRSHFWPFTEVLRKILRFVTPKCRNLENHGWHGSDLRQKETKAVKIWRHLAAIDRTGLCFLRYLLLEERSNSGHPISTSLPPRRAG
ncbi:MAG: hypothetical protein DME50_10885 [Verrucomicrobia bacterium]|nr:MAG: hypothetical protein DME50_10885 [Verrucomicrobiota bacterium]